MQGTVHFPSALPWLRPCLRMLHSRDFWLFAAAAAAAAMALVAAANGSAALHRRWPASDAELKRLEAKLGYTFRGEGGSGRRAAGRQEVEQACRRRRPACLPPHPTRGFAYTRPALTWVISPRRQVDAAPGPDPPVLWRDE